MYTVHAARVNSKKIRRVDRSSYPRCSRDTERANFEISTKDFHYRAFGQAWVTDKPVKFELVLLLPRFFPTSPRSIELPNPFDSVLSADRISRLLSNRSRSILAYRTIAPVSRISSIGNFQRNGICSELRRQSCRSVHETDSTGEKVDGRGRRRRYGHEVDGPTH